MPRWLLFTLLTMLLWGGWGVLTKPLADQLSSWQIQVFSTVGLLPVLAVLAFSNNLKTGANNRLGFWLAFAAGIIGSGGNVSCYQALAAGGKAAAVIPFTSLYPVVTIALALMFLRERLNPIQCSGLGASLLALYCFNVGGGESWLTPWLAVALAPVALWGASAFLQKLSTMHASIELATLAFLLGFIPVAVVVPLFQPMSVQLPGGTWLLLGLLGLFFGLGNLTLIFAYGTGGKASVVTPLAGLYSIVTIPMAVLILREQITGREAAGIGLALIAVVALSREKAPAVDDP